MNNYGTYDAQKPIFIKPDSYKPAVSIELAYCCADQEDRENAKPQGVMFKMSPIDGSQPVICRTNSVACLNRTIAALTRMRDKLWPKPENMN